MSIDNDVREEDDTLLPPEERATLREGREESALQEEEDEEWDEEEASEAEEDGEEADEASDGEENEDGEEDDEEEEGGGEQTMSSAANDDEMPWLVATVKWLVAAPICLLLAYLGLVFNEQDSATQRHALRQLAQETTELQDIATLNPALNDRPVYVHGSPQTSLMLSDPEFGISVPTVKLCRSVEYYQWTETTHTTKHKEEDGTERTTTSYTHSKAWVSHRVNSLLFKEDKQRYANTCAYKSDSFSDVAEDAHLGAFPLDKSWLTDIPCSATVDPATIKLPEEIRARSVSHNGYIYVGTAPPKPRQPQVGDVRIRWSYVPQDASMGIIARQEGTRLTPIPHPDLEEDVFKVSFPGDNKEEMLGEYTESLWQLWLMRILGTATLIPVLAWIPGVGRLIPRMDNWRTACVLACAVSAGCMLLFETDRPVNAAMDAAVYLLIGLLLWRKLRSPF